MISRGENSPLDDIEFLARSDHRVTALDALATRPQSRTDLRELTGVSRSTVGRTLREFEARRWIRRERDTSTRRHSWAGSSRRDCGN